MVHSYGPILSTSTTDGSWMVWLSHVSIKSLEALPGGRSHSAAPRKSSPRLVTDVLADDAPKFGIQLVRIQFLCAFYVDYVEILCYETSNMNICESYDDILQNMIT